MPPHLTLDVVGSDVTLETPRAELADVLPARCTAERIELHRYEPGNAHLQASWSLGAPLCQAPSGSSPLTARPPSTGSTAPLMKLAPGDSR